MREMKKKKRLNLKGKYHLGDLRVDGGCYQNVYKDTRYKDVAWSYPVQCKTQWRVVLKM
jgi:hypothetical protein